MPPNTLLGLLLFLWLVTPGFLFTLLAARRRAAAKESAFQEAARVILASVLFSGVAAAIAAALVLGGTRTEVDLGRLIAGGRPYLAQHYRAIGLFLVLQILLACALAGLGNHLLAHQTRRATGQAAPRLLNESAWDRPLGRLPANSRPLIWLRLESGIELRGMVAAYGHEIDVKERELVLKKPIEIRYPGQAAMHALQEHRLVVQGTDIEFLSVQYVTKDPTAAGTVQRRRWWQRWWRRLHGRPRVAVDAADHEAAASTAPQQPETS